MTIVGLPTHVESILATLLSDHLVKSWKVAGEGEDTVFVLRLSASQHGQEAAITAPTGQWRKKSAAQIRRDRRRAELRAEQRRTQVGINSCNTMPDFQTHPLKDLAPVPTIKNDNANSSAVTSDSVKQQHSIERSRETRSLATPTQHTPAHCDTASLTTCEIVNSEVCCAVTSQTADDETTVAELAATDREFEPDDVYDLASHCSQNVQLKEKLLNRKRNRTLTKVVCERKGGKKTLIARGDDYVLTYDCETAQTTSFQEEEETPPCVRRLPQVDRNVFGEEIDHLTTDLHVVSTLVQCYLRAMPD